MRTNRLWSGRSCWSDGLCRCHRLSENRHWNAESRGDSCGLNGIEFTHTRGHKEALDQTQNRGNSGPEKTQVQDSEPRASQVEMVYAKYSQEQSKQDAHHFIAPYSFVLLIENRLRVGID